MYDLLSKSYDWINWVELIASKNDWPTLWISVCTHGWEVVWLDILKSLIEEIQIAWKLTKWRIFLILNNIEAFKKYKALVESWVKISSDDLVSTRFVDQNMNRCCSEENLTTSTSYEVRRVLELMPILQQLDIIFDIHSTYSPSDSMAILTKRSHEQFEWVFNVDKELVWITEVQTWKPFIDVVERNWWVWIWIESWCQLDETWYKIWLDNSLRLLTHLWMLNSNDEEVERHLLEWVNKQTLNIFWSVIIRWRGFKFYKDYRHLDEVKKWELFCFDWENDRYAERDFLIILPKPNMQDATKLIWEEWCFMWNM